MVSNWRATAGWPEYCTSICGREAQLAYRYGVPTALSRVNFSTHPPPCQQQFSERSQQCLGSYVSLSLLDQCSHRLVAGRVLPRAESQTRFTSSLASEADLKLKAPLSGYLCARFSYASTDPYQPSQAVCSNLSEFRTQSRV